MASAFGEFAAELKLLCPFALMVWAACEGATETANAVKVRKLPRLAMALSTPMPKAAVQVVARCRVLGGHADKGGRDFTAASV